MPKKTAPALQKTRIQSQNEALILDAALEVFSAYGYRGTTVDQIAGKCGMSKPNLLYYFKRKEDIYTAVLQRTLSLWLAPLQALDADKDPISELTRYITAKLDLTLERPEASKLFANEILHGAPHVSGFLKGPLRELVAAKASVIKRWVANGQINPVSAEHLIFAIWAVTQHYADFGVQVDAVLGGKIDAKHLKGAVLDILLRGLKVDAGTRHRDGVVR
jgi:TetR/AcrR family transcriptional regulator